MGIGQFTDQMAPSDGVMENIDSLEKEIKTLAHEANGLRAILQVLHPEALKEWDRVNSVLPRQQEQKCSKN